MLDDGPQACLRLSRILEEGGRVSTRHPEYSDSGVIERVLGLTDETAEVRLRRVNRFRDLPVIIRRSIFGLELELPLEWLDTIRSIESAMLSFPDGSKWDSRFGSIAADSSVVLRGIAQALVGGESSPKQSLTTAGLADLRLQVLQALDSLDGVSISEELRRFVTTSLRDILDAVDDYKVGGNTGLGRVMDEVRSGYADAVGRDPVGVSKIRRAVMVFVTAAALVHASGQAVQGTHRIIDELPWLEQNVAKVIPHSSGAIEIAPEDGSMPVVYRFQPDE